MVNGKSRPMPLWRIRWWGKEKKMTLKSYSCISSFKNRISIIFSIFTVVFNCNAQEYNCWDVNDSGNCPILGIVYETPYFTPGNFLSVGDEVCIFASVFVGDGMTTLQQFELSQTTDYISLDLYYETFGMYVFEPYCEDINIDNCIITTNPGILEIRITYYNGGGYVNHCVLGEVEVLSADCSQNFTLDNVTCFDNLTPTNNNDDVIEFDLLVDGLNIASDYIISSDIGSINPAIGIYQNWENFSLEGGSAGSGNDYEITITDSDDQTCTLSFTVQDPGSCSTDNPGDDCSEPGPIVSQRSGSNFISVEWETPPDPVSQFIFRYKESGTQDWSYDTTFGYTDFIIDINDESSWQNCCPTNWIIPVPTFTLAGLPPCTSYNIEFAIVCTASPWSQSEWSTTATLFSGFCSEPYYDGACYNKRQSNCFEQVCLVMEGIDDCILTCSPDCCPMPMDHDMGYSIYQDGGSLLQTDSSNRICINIGRAENGGTFPTYDLAGYIDWNEDLDFDDAGERIFEALNQSDLFCDYIDVPGGVNPGVKRLRVATSLDGLPLPCNSLWQQTNLPVSGLQYDDHYSLCCIN